MASVQQPVYLQTATYFNDHHLPSGRCILSVVTSALNEAANVPTFLHEVCGAIADLRIASEIIFIDDGSRDDTASLVEQFANDHDDIPIRLIRHWRPRGLAVAFSEGTAAARGKYVCFLPADLESSPAEDIPKLFHAMDDDHDIVLGRRIGRGDGKRLSSNVYNFLNALIFGVRVRDGNWIKLLRKDCMIGIHLRNDWHPFLVPILANTGCRYKEIDTNWYPRRHGRSKFGFKRFAFAAAAALSVKFHLTFGSRPMLFFFGTAAGMIFLGTILLIASFFVNMPGDRLWSALQMFSVGFYVAGWISATTGLVVDILNLQSIRTEK